MKVNWLEQRFWPPYRGKTAAQVAVTLNHIRRQQVNRQEVGAMVAFTTMPHADRFQFEIRQNQRCIESLGRRVNG